MAAGIRIESSRGSKLENLVANQNDKQGQNVWAGYACLVDAVVVFDMANNKARYLNPAADELADYSRRMGLGLSSPASWLAKSTDQAISSDLGASDANIGVRRQGVCHFGHCYEATLQRYSTTGSEDMLVGVFRDVSERAEAERQKKELVSTVSHELRSPLTAIKGAMGLVLSGAIGEVPDKAHQMIAIAQRNADRLVLIINDILDLDKIADGAMVFDNSNADPIAVIGEAVEAIAGFQARFDVDVTIDMVDADLVSFVDPNRMVQILVYLLPNAIKFSPAEGHVTVQVFRHGDFNRISVIDQGEGIPDADQETLFGRFVQVGAKLRAATGGTGLGLSIVKAIVGKQGGAISFESEVGNGTTSHVDLPSSEQTNSINLSMSGTVL